MEARRKTQVAALEKSEEKLEVKQTELQERKRNLQVARESHQNAVNEEAEHFMEMLGQREAPVREVTQQNCCPRATA